MLKYKLKKFIDERFQLFTILQQMSEAGIFQKHNRLQATVYFYKAFFCSLQH